METARSTQSEPLTTTTLADVLEHMRATQPAPGGRLPPPLYRCPKCSELNARAYKQDRRGSKCECTGCGYKFRLVPSTVDTLPTSNTP